ncbi:MAG: helix-turn-helix domain-containing protein [Lentisphaerae bacterium]|nr:MAG: helix-turn-helix domain-containing protein [Lentisphaerota bacterium]
MTSSPTDRRIRRAPERHRPQVLFIPSYRDERMLEGICQYAFEAGWVLDLFFYRTGTIPKDWHGDGILCLLNLPNWSPNMKRFILAQREAGVPMVDLALNDPQVKIPRVLQDDRAIGRLAAEYLISLGIRRLAFCTRTFHHPYKERFAGFQEIAAQKELPCSLIQIPDDFSAEEGLPVEFQQEPPSIDQPLGIMAAADPLANWVIQACQVSGLKIPENVALISVENDRYLCELGTITVSSIDNNALRQGYEAARLLDRLIHGEEAPEEPVYIPPGALHVRESSNLLAVRHPHVANALRQIAQRFRDPELKPAHIAARIPMSARRLHDAFVKYVGRSMYQEITHRRLQYAKKLIQETDQKMWDIAQSAGFSSPEVMSRLFSRWFGHPPSYFRRLK